MGFGPEIDALIDKMYEEPDVNDLHPRHIKARAAQEQRENEQEQKDWLQKIEELYANHGADEEIETREPHQKPADLEESRRQEEFKAAMRARNTKEKTAQFTSNNNTVAPGEKRIPGKTNTVVPNSTYRRYNR